MTLLFPLRRLGTVFCVSLLTTGLVAQVASDDRAHEDDDEKEIVTLSPFEVKDDQSGYTASNAFSGTRFRSDLLTMPKPIDIVTSEFISDIGARSLYDAMMYVTGVPQEQPNNSSATDTGFRYRGFAHTNVYRNGFRALGLIDPIMIDRLEILKGPSSNFAGTISPGGVINYITRRPTQKPMANLKQSVGSYGLLRSEIDLGGPVAATDGKLSYRIAGAYEQADSHREFEHTEKNVITGAVEYRINDRTSVSGNYSAIKRTGTLIYAAPLRIGEQRWVEMPRSFNQAGPEALRSNSHSQAELTIDHRLNDNLSLRLTGFLGNSFFDRKDPTIPNTLIIEPGTGRRLLNRTALMESQANRDLHGMAFLLAEYGSKDTVRYRGNLAVERYYEFAGVYRYVNPAISGAAGRLDIDNPDYSLGPDSAYNVRSGNAFDLDFAYNSISLMNQLEFFDARLLLQFGGRRDIGEQVITNYIPATPVKIYVPIEANTYSGGISYRLREGVAAYVSYNESFQPVSGLNAQGNPYKPLMGKGYDAGIKFNLMNGRVSGSVAAFNMDSINILRNDPANPGFRVQSGEENSQGAEGGVQLNLKGLQLTTGYSYMDAKVVSHTDLPALEGVRLVNTPTHSGNFWAKYTVQEGPLAKFKIGLGVIYVGNRSAGGFDREDGIRVPSYTRLDMLLGYETKLLGKRTVFSVNVANLLDRDYFISSGARSAPRMMAGNMTIQF